MVASQFLLVLAMFAEVMILLICGSKHFEELLNDAGCKSDVALLDQLTQSTYVRGPSCNY